MLVKYIVISKYPDFGYFEACFSPKVDRVDSVTACLILPTCLFPPNMFDGVLMLQRPPSSSLSYPGHGSEDVRSPGSGGTPGPLSQAPQLDHSDPGMYQMRNKLFSFNFCKYGPISANERI